MNSEGAPMVQKSIHEPRNANEHPNSIRTASNETEIASVKSGNKKHKGIREV